MKILFFSYAFPNPIHPGLGTFNRTMLTGLAQSHQVRVVSPVPFPDVWKAWSTFRLPGGLNNPQFQAIPDVPAEYVSWYYTPKYFRDHYGRFMSRSVSSVLNRTMQEFQPDVVLSYWTHPDGEVAVKTARQFGVRSVTIVGGSDVLINARSGSRRESILNVLREADGVVTVSEDIKRVLMNDGISDAKLYVARRGTDRRVFHDGDQTLARRNLSVPNDLPIIVSVGRLVDVKGHVHLIDACQKLSERGLRYRCFLVGDGPLRSALQHQIQKAGLEGTVVLTGPKSATELAEWYRAADLSVLASLSEGVPNVLLESMACGTPFVASHVGGIPEIADPDLDRLVPAANPVALADAIQAQLQKPHREIHQARCFEPPTMSGSAEGLSRILRSVLRGQNATSLNEIIMHETMTDMDVMKEVHPLHRSGTNEGTTMSDNSASNEFNDDDDDALGRTGENFQIDLQTAMDFGSTIDHDNSTSSRTGTAVTKHCSPLTNPSTSPVRLESDEDNVGRTGEAFHYRPS